MKQPIGFSCVLAVAIVCLAAGPIFDASAGEKSGYASAGAPKYEALAGRLKALLTANNIALSDAGVKIVSMRTGETLIDNYADKLFIPASNQKLVSTAAALHLLGPDFRFQTLLYARGKIAQGVLDGDLIVVGGGDPDISGRNHGGDPRFLFKTWAKVLKDSGISEVSGSIIADVSAFDGVLVHPTWPRNQQDKWYCAPVSALALNDNCVDITVSAGPEPGAPAKVSIVPDTSYARVTNNCATTSARGEHLFGFLGRAGSEGLVLRGKFWLSGSPLTTNVPVDDPPVFFLTALKETLQAEGIAVKGTTVAAAEPVPVAAGCKLLHTFATPLEQAVTVANKRSQNFYAEQILKTLGWKTSGKGTFDSGAAAIKGFLGKVSTHGKDCEIADGSGLSRKNLLSASAVTDLLVWIVKQPGGAAFANSLSVAGSDGTMDGRMTQEPCSGRVRAKTGTIAGVSSLSGYIEVPGDALAFSMLMNSSKAGVWRMKLAQDAICKEVIEFFLQQAPKK
ncbi:MAG TPA: D-alanyl-D-alanine carboxypeptidase/D-alanyl-D-alanine-endopeptidase [Planctomycetota bacterium]|nr:D-alanyl-D-alanine carboxypeptidase/D-alanyl-D-alanine-endopeptidase [Planctomycetota bacterium]